MILKIISIFFNFTSGERNEAYFKYQREIQNAPINGLRMNENFRMKVGDSGNNGANSGCEGNSRI